jgi:hypothetical protein
MGMELKYSDTVGIYSAGLLQRYVTHELTLENTFDIVSQPYGIKIHVVLRYECRSLIRISFGSDSLISVVLA